MIQMSTLPSYPHNNKMKVRILLYSATEIGITKQHCHSLQGVEQGMGAGGRRGVSVICVGVVVFYYLFFI